MNIQTGFALVKTSDGSIIQSWNAHPAAPPSRIFIEGELDVHGAVAGDTFADGAYALVERWTDDPGLPAPRFAPTSAVAFDGQKVVETISYSSTPEMSAVANVIKTECARRIYAYASDNAQKNMLANVVAGVITGDDLATYKAAVTWIGEMQAACRAMIASADASYGDDAKWPPLPDGVLALVARF